MEKIISAFVWTATSGFVNSNFLFAQWPGLSPLRLRQMY
jgi:hypothetical protein